MVEQLLNILNFFDVLGMQNFDNDLLDWIEIENLKMWIVDMQSNLIWVEKFVDI